MKHFKTICLSILALTLIYACSSDDDNGDSQSAEITEENFPGTYPIKSVTTDVEIDANADGNFGFENLIDYVDTDNLDQECDNVLVFNTDGTFSVTTANYYQSYDGTHDNVENYDTVECEYYGPSSGTYSFGGSTVTLNYESGYQRILEINGSEIILKTDDDQFVVENQGSYMYETVETLYTFEK